MNLARDCGGSWSLPVLPKAHYFPEFVGGHLAPSAPHLELHPRILSEDVWTVSGTKSKFLIKENQSQILSMQSVLLY